MNALAAILNIFVDPAETVRRIRIMGKLAWVWPVIISSVVVLVISYASIPYILSVMQNNPPAGVDPAQMERSLSAVQTGVKFSAALAPIGLLTVMLVNSALLLGAGAIGDVRVKFHELFSLLAHCSLIPMLAQVAHLVVLKAKGDRVQSMQELRPSFGLDLLLPDGSSKLLLGFLNYFSIFTIWFIVILAIGYAALAHTSKAKAFVLTSPVWILGLFFAAVGALFSR